MSSLDQFSISEISRSVQHDFHARPIGKCKRCYKNKSIVIQIVCSSEFVSVLSKVNSVQEMPLWEVGTFEFHAISIYSSDSPGMQFIPDIDHSRFNFRCARAREVILRQVLPFLGISVAIVYLYIRTSGARYYEPCSNYLRRSEYFTIVFVTFHFKWWIIMLSFKLCFLILSLNFITSACDFLTHHWMFSINRRGIKKLICSFAYVSVWVRVT